MQPPNHRLNLQQLFFTVQNIQQPEDQEFDPSPYPYTFLHGSEYEHEYKYEKKNEHEHEYDGRCCCSDR